MATNQGIRCILFFVILPLLVGRGIGVKRHSGTISTWASGNIVMMAVAQVLLIPFIIYQRSLNTFITVWFIIIVVIAIKGIGAIASGKKWNEFKIRCAEIKGTEKILIIAAWGLILGQAMAAAYLQHSDADDSRFVAEAVISVERNCLYKYDPISGEVLNSLLTIGDVRKDLTSPWPMYIALVSKICGTAPAITCHLVIPFFYVILSYSICGLIGYELMDKNYKKTMGMLIVLSVFNLFDYTSTHTISTVMLFRIWQGKAVVATIIIPMLILCITRILKGEKAFIQLYNTVFAASLASGIGITISLVILGIGIISEFFINRNWKTMGGLSLGMIPCTVYLLCQLNYWSIFIEKWIY